MNARKRCTAPARRIPYPATTSGRSAAASHVAIWPTSACSRVLDIKRKGDPCRAGALFGHHRVGALEDVLEVVHDAAFQSEDGPWLHDIDDVRLLRADLADFAGRTVLRVLRARLAGDEEARDGI